MTSQSGYQPAQQVSEKAAKHFADTLREARERGEKDLAPEPGARVIEAMIDVAFWASLQREEGHAPKISLAYLPPEQSVPFLLFEQRMPLNSGTLTKLSPGVERPGIHLGVWQEDGELYIWGTTHLIPNLCFVLDVSEPGLLVVKHRRVHGLGKFANVAILKGDQVKVIDTKGGATADSPAILKALLGMDSDSYHDNSVNVLVQLAVSMRAHKHGGTLLVVPDQSDSWKKSIIHPVKYAVHPPYKGIAHLIRQEVHERGPVLWMEAFRKEVDSIAGLTAVDGATVMNDRYELLAFGAKISRPDGKVHVEQIIYCEPVVGGGSIQLNPAQLGGTRHLSAAQFVHDQHDCLALVASQDGHFTIFSWSEASAMVQAHRIDTLLL